MADTRLPDVVPAKDLASGKEAVELMSGSAAQLNSDNSQVEMPDWHSMTVLSANEDHPSDTPIVHIWSSSDSNDSNDSSLLAKPEEVCSRLEHQIEHRSDSQLGSDSGIDSQLASPTVIDGGYNKLQEQSAFVLDLSANHLSVPSRMKLGSLRSSLEKHSQQQQQPKLNKDEPPIVENSVHGTGEQRNDPSPANTIPTSPRFLPQKRHHRNFLPVDYSLDGWQSPRSDNFLKIRSLPSECEQQTEMEETNSLAVSWSDTSSTPTTNAGRKQQATTSSPKICVQRDAHVDRSFHEGQSSIVSERSCSYDSQESSHFLADQESDSRCYSPSRKPSFGSIGSDSCTDNNMDSRTSIKPTRSSHHNSLSRSSSSRSTFLSVPTRVPNHLWLSSTSDHQTDHNKEQHGQSSANSQQGSTSSLMASHFSLSNPYLRLCLNEGGINDALLLSLAGDETNHHAVLDMFDDPYYDSATAAAVQLSLTQRLAFPQLLVENDPESDKQNNRHQQRNQLPREEGSLNFFAKIITFLVLVFVIVLVVGVLVKISHTPR